MENNLTVRRISAAVLLLLLLVVPFLDWRLGMLLWLCAWIMFIISKLFDRREWKVDPPDDGEE